MRTVMAVDGGNSKTHLALVRDDGHLLSLVRGPLSSPHHLGVQGCLEVLERLFGEAAREAGIARGSEPPAELAELLVAGVDFPTEELELQEAAEERGWARRIVVRNDTFAVLRAGTESGWGVAVVCGAGINCVGVAPDGRHARFPALGSITGDWGGGHDIGIAAVSAAARSEDGRGPRTSLERAVPAYFGLGTPSELAEAIHRRRIAARRVIELAPVVFAEAADDAVAADLVERLAHEAVALVRVSLERLELSDRPVEVLLGGGLMQSNDRRLLDAIERGVHAVAPAASVHVTSSPPIVGAALFALDDLGASPEAQARLRAELGAAAESAVEEAGVG